MDRNPLLFNQIYFIFLLIQNGYWFRINIWFNITSKFQFSFQSNSLIEFWERWNITLSRFIEIIYQPIFRFLQETTQFFSNHIYSILISMTISGLWHGANWNFILWFNSWSGIALNHFLSKKIFYIYPYIFKEINFIDFLKYYICYIQKFKYGFNE